MVKHTQPSKEDIREWLRAEIARRRPPPDPGQIRREAGWEPVPAMVALKPPRRPTGR